MGSNAGSGYPSYFRCWRCRQSDGCTSISHKAIMGRSITRPGYNHCNHKQVRTGRTKPIKRGRYGTGIRCTNEQHEYRCECGHVGWSKHKGVLRLPLAPEAST